MIGRNLRIRPVDPKDALKNPRASLLAKARELKIRIVHSERTLFIHICSKV
jgi:hypothetical protein